MGITMTGCLLRRERLRQNLSLEGVAGGVCTAAHLSKIEKGLAQPSPEMVRRLFASLKIDFIQDPALLREPAEALEQYFDAILHNEDTHLLAAYIRENVTLLNNSICHVDYHLFRLDQQEVSQKYGDEVEYLASFYCCMSENQKFFYRYLSAEVQNDYPPGFPICWKQSASVRGRMFSRTRCMSSPQMRQPRRLPSRCHWPPMA